MQGGIHESEGVVTPVGLRAWSRRRREGGVETACWVGGERPCGAGRMKGHRTGGYSESARRIQTSAGVGG